MTSTETDAGTPVLDLSAEEYREFLDHEAERRLGMTADEFVRRYQADELDDGDPDVGMLVALIGVGQGDDDRIPA